MSRRRRRSSRRLAGLGPQGLPLLAAAGGAGLLAFLFLSNGSEEEANDLYERGVEAAQDITDAAEELASDAAQTVRETGESIVTTLRNFTDNASWALNFGYAVDAALPELPYQSKLIIVAHAAYESGWGRTWQAQNVNNFFNVTAGSWWLGKGYPSVLRKNADHSLNPDECKRLGREMLVRTDARGQPLYDGAPCCLIDQIWRVYDSVNTCLRDYRDFLTIQNRGVYAPAWNALLSGNPYEFGMGLYRSGYFTAQPGKYIASITSIVNKTLPGYGV